MNSKDLYKHLRLIEQTSGLNQKKILLKRADGQLLHHVLYFTYNPHFNFYTRSINLKSVGDMNLKPSHFRVLRKITDSEIRGHAGECMLNKIAYDLNEESRILLQNIIDRDLRIGLNIKSINDVFPTLIPTHDVMLAHKIDWARVRFPCYSSIKFDGMRAIYNDGTFFTRSGKEITSVQWFADVLKQEGLPSLDGELTVPGNSFQVGAGKIRRLSRVSSIHYNLIDTPEMTELPYDTRYTFLEQFSRSVVQMSAIPQIIVNNKEEALDHYRWCQDEGYEGTIIKPIDYEYERKRSHLWMKLKSIDTLDLPVVGYFEGTGKYREQLGGLIVDFKGHHVRVGGGFSDLQRDKWWKGRDRILKSNRKIEVLYQEITDGGKSLRHPRFVKFRMDLPK